MRFVVLLCALVIGVATGLSAPVAAADSGAPDLSQYAQISVDDYVAGTEVYFQTPDGLLCAIRPSPGLAGCDGPLAAAPAGTNEIVLTADPHQRGLRSTASPQFVKPTGGAAPVLQAGHSLRFADFVCAVGDGGSTSCTKGDPVAQWFTVSPQRADIGPATAGLPPTFPDPTGYVLTDDSYIVGAGAKNLFPVFTVASGLTCKMAMFSGGEIACDGTLPGIRTADNEVFVQLPGTAGTRRAGSPPFSAPSYPGTVKALPAGHRIESNGATCMATADGGVACFGSAGGPPQGFMVTATETTTFGGTP
jgi:hypothetical protein